MFVNIGQWSVQVSNVFIVPTCFDLTNLKGEKRRNVGKLNNELNIVNQPCRSPFLVVCKHYRKLKEPPCAYSANNHR
jgi:hypothetical protein